MKTLTLLIVRKELPDWVSGLEYSKLVPFSLFSLGYILV